jgi:hypothetical protein
MDRQSAELTGQGAVLLLVEVLVANEHDLVLRDQSANEIDVAAWETDREIQSVEDGPDRGGEALDLETAVGRASRTNRHIGRRRGHAAIVTEVVWTCIRRSTRTERRSDDCRLIRSADLGESPSEDSREPGWVATLVPLAGPYDAGFVGEHHRLHATADAELGQEVAHVGLHRGLADD